MDPLNKKALIQALEQVSELRFGLELERAARIAAETLAAERLKENEHLARLAATLEASRAEAVNARLKSLDLVNSKLLELVIPEKAPATPPKPSSDEMRPLAAKQRVRGPAVLRGMEVQALRDAVLRAAKSSPEPSQPATVFTESQHPKQ